MTERVQTNHKLPEQDQAADACGTAKSPERPWPSREERLARIREYQGKALENDDAHLANVELFDGDIMLLALRLRELMDRDLIEGTVTAEASRRFAQRTELLLKCVRQIDRNARIKRQLTQLAKEDSGPG